MSDLDHTSDYETLEPAAQRAERILRAADPQVVTANAGVDLAEAEGSATLVVSFLTGAYLVRLPGLELVEQATGKPCSFWLRNLLLLHLAQADGTPLAGKWISFGELPDGLFYQKAFRGYSGDALVRAFDNDAQALEQACLALGGEPEPVGEVGFRFAMLPRVPLALAYWQGEEEIAPSARFLFDASASHYLPTDALAVMGGWLTGKLVRQKTDKGSS
jgi:hypothetical protein